MTEINALIDGFLDNELTADDAGAIEAWIASDREHAKEFLRSVAVHSSIHDQLSACERLRTIGVADETARGLALPDASQPTIVDTVNASSEKATLPGRRKRTLLQHASHRPGWPSIAVAVVLMAGLVGWAAVTYLPDRSSPAADNIRP
jgi:anti-sigma factor RsiW